MHCKKPQNRPPQGESPDCETTHGRGPPCKHLHSAPSHPCKTPEDAGAETKQAQCKQSESRQDALQGQSTARVMDSGTSHRALQDANSRSARRQQCRQHADRGAAVQGDGTGDHGLHRTALHALAHACKTPACAGPKRTSPHIESSVCRESQGKQPQHGSAAVD